MPWTPGAPLRPAGKGWGGDPRGAAKALWVSRHCCELLIGTDVSGASTELCVLTNMTRRDCLASACSRWHGGRNGSSTRKYSGNRSRVETPRNQFEPLGGVQAYTAKVCVRLNAWLGVIEVCEANAVASLVGDSAPADS